MTAIWKIKTFKETITPNIHPTHGIRPCYTLVWGDFLFVVADVAKTVHAMKIKIYSKAHNDNFIKQNVTPLNNNTASCRENENYTNSIAEKLWDRKEKEV